MTLEDSPQELAGKAAVARSIEQGWRERNGFKLHDAVKLPGVDCVFEVVDLTDPSLIGLRTPSGKLIKAGWRIVSRVKKGGAE